MYDILPFPNITGENPAEQLEQINSYLIQLKEELEFILTRISLDNLSEDLRRQFASLGADITANKTDQEVVNQQIINRSLTVDDVISSEAFDNALDDVRDEIPTFTDSKEGIVVETEDENKQVFKITVNYDTGYLDYTI